jgi:hypothetical protein
MSCWTIAHDSAMIKRERQTIKWLKEKKEKERQTNRDREREIKNDREIDREIKRKNKRLKNIKIATETKFLIFNLRERES